jgi:hypothetical protein
MFGAHVGDDAFEGAPADWALNARAARFCGPSPRKCRSASGSGRRSGLVKDGTPDAFEALAGRCPVFRFDPVEQP